jgi:outer membrane protein assembly factor BamB
MFRIKKMDGKKKMKANRKYREQAVASVTGTMLTLPIALLIVAATMMWGNNILKQIDNYEQTLKDTEVDKSQEEVDVENITLNLDSSIYWQDDFEGQQLQWNKRNSYTIVETFHNKHFYTKGHSANISTDAETPDDTVIGIKKDFPWQPFRNISIEIAFTIDSNQEYHELSIYQDGEKQEKNGAIRLYTNGEIHIIDDSGSTLIDTIFLQDTAEDNPFCWHTMKLLIDCKTGKYISGSVDGKHYALEDYYLKNYIVEDDYNDSITVEYNYSYSGGEPGATSYIDDFVFRKISMMKEGEYTMHASPYTPPVADAHGPYTGNTNSFRLTKTLTGWGPLELHSEVYSVDFNHDGSLIAVVSGQTNPSTTDNEVYIFQTSNWAHIKTLSDATTQSIWSVNFNHDGSLLAVGSGDFNVYIYDTSTWNNIHTLTDSTLSVRTVNFNHDGSLLAVGSNDFNVYIYDTSTWTNIKTLTDSEKAVYSINFNHDSSLLAVGSYDNKVYIYDTSTWTNIKTLTDSTDWIYSVNFNHDNSLLAVGSRDYNVYIYDTSSWNNIRTLTDATFHVLSVDFNHDGSLLAVGTRYPFDTKVYIYDTSSWTSIETLTDSSFDTHSVKFNHDGSLLAVGSHDEKVYIYDIGGTNQISFTGSATGGTPPYTYNWDLDNDGSYDDSPLEDPTINVDTYWSTTGTYTIGLQVTDNTATIDTDTTTVTIVMGGLDSGPWPKFLQNELNKGLSSYDTSFVDGTVKWTFSTGAVTAHSPTIGSDGTIYVGTAGSQFGLYALNPDGSQKWRFTEDGLVNAPTIGADGTIYIGSTNDNLYAVNPDGTQKWVYTMGGSGFGDIRSDANIGSDGTIYIGSRDDSLHAINPDGSQKWEFPTGGNVDSSPAIASDGTIYIGSQDGNVYAVNPDGSQKWAFSAGTWIDSSPAIASDGTIYIGCRNNRLYAINPDGTEKWSYTTFDDISSSPAIASDGTIYIGCGDTSGILYAINPDGTEKWSYTIGDISYASPAIGSDGTIYIGSYDDNFYAINPDGTEKWSYTVGNFISSSAAIGSDGIVYISDATGDVYAFEGSTGGGNNPPNKPNNPSPSQGDTQISLNPTLSVDVSDPDGDTMDVTFYDASDDSVISTDFNVASGSTASVTWSGLERGFDYTWYAVADDGTDSTKGDDLPFYDFWFFATLNDCPDEPATRSPADGATGLGLNPTLSISVYDNDDNTMTAEFLDVADVTNPISIGTVNNLHNGDTASVQWNGLSPGTTYYWRVDISDGPDHPYTGTCVKSTVRWSFTTAGNAHLAINPSSQQYDFGSQLEGVQPNPTCTFTIENDGDSGSTLTYSISESESWIVDVNPSSGSLNEGETSTINVEIATRDMITGVNSGVLNIDTNANDESFTVNVDVSKWEVPTGGSWSNEWNGDLQDVQDGDGGTCLDSDPWTINLGWHWTDWASFTFDTNEKADEVYTMIENSPARIVSMEVRFHYWDDDYLGGMWRTHTESRSAGNMPPYHVYFDLGYLLPGISGSTEVNEVEIRFKLDKDVGDPPVYAEIFEVQCSTP